MAISSESNCRTVAQRRVKTLHDAGQNWVWPPIKAAGDRTKWLVSREMLRSQKMSAWCGVDVKYELHHFKIGDD